MSEIYLLHFSRPYWGHAQHYCGYTKFTAEERLEHHRAGTGSRICRFANRNGITYQVVYREGYDTSSEARKREIQLKRERNLKRHCPICNKKIIGGVA